MKAVCSESRQRIDKLSALVHPSNLYAQFWMSLPQTEVITCWSLTLPTVDNWRLYEKLSLY